MNASRRFSTPITRPAVGLSPRARAPLPGAILALAALLVGMGLLGTDAAWALDTGTLKLMVTTCSGTPHDDALVEVEIHREGSGVVATDNGYTQNGYVEFTSSILEGGDMARVTAEACGSEEATHKYVWVSENGNMPGVWDIETLPNSVCTDTWWDEQEGIIQLRCD